MTNPNHTDTSRSGDLVASLRALSAWLIANDLDMKLPDEVGDPDDAADRIEALEASVTGLTHQRDFLRESVDLSDQRIEALEAENERLRLELSDTATKYSWAVDTFNTGFSGYEAVLLHQRRIADEGPPSNWKDGMKAYAARAALGEKQ